MKTTAKSRRLSVALTPRQYDALRGYTSSIDVAMGAYARVLLTQSIPTQFWGREEPPPGQMTFDEGGFPDA